MKHNLTDLTLIIDRSGSMQSCRTDAEGGANQFIDDQKKQPGECLLSLVQFDTEYEFVHRGKPIKEVTRYTLVPRGSTALLDAVGRAINETGERLAKMNEDDRPGLVAFVIVTDGQENASHEFSKTQIKEMIERQQKDYQWQFTFLGANQDAFAEASGMGMQAKDAANYAPDKMMAAYAASSGKLSRMRAASLAGDTYAVASADFTEEEREEMK